MAISAIDAVMGFLSYRRKGPVNLEENGVGLDAGPR